MKDYTNYELVDFLSDDSFVEWVTSKSQNGDNFWSVWPVTYPHKAEVYYQAVEITSSLSFKPVAELSQAEISILVHKLVNTAEKGNKTDGIRQLEWYKKGWVRVAAAVLIIATTSMLVYQGYDSASKPTAQIVAYTDSYREIVKPGIIRLPDNSTVILKKGSKIKYANTFTKSKREVYLEGEAFFEVTKDAHRPFIVRTNELITKVLGTSFSIRAYNNDKEFNVTVNTGKVSVFAKAGASDKDLSSKSLENIENGGLLISPNQKVTFYRDYTRFVKKKLEVPTELSMEVASTKLNFVDAPFSEVINALSKAYDIKIIYDKNKIGNCPLTASLSKQQLYEKLDLICQAVEAKYKIEDGNIVIDGKGCTN